jgi:hypothetical protein
MGSSPMRGPANLDRHAAHTVAAYLAGMSANWERSASPP